jgi:hypothetical protein
MLSRTLHKHRYAYSAANGDPATARDYEARGRFVTRRCACGASGHNVGYAPAPEAFEPWPTAGH